MGEVYKATNSSISGLTRSGALTCLGMLGNQAEERSRFCDSHGGCSLGDPHGRLRNLSTSLYEKRKNVAQEVSSFPFPAEISDFDVASRNFDRSEDFRLFMNRIVRLRCAD
ncbi:hypothetical protein Syun_017632 [Stephania yunnanensis]|uniref:Uncharacterized protein n=1 Tax=Stephania yunnanensis TaxID=152371 RepID=A0AAP0J8Z8_9MAGN